MLPPSARQLSFEWIRRPEDRGTAEQERLNAIRALSTELTAALNLAEEFADLIRKRSVRRSRPGTGRPRHPTRTSGTPGSNCRRGLRATQAGCQVNRLGCRVVH